MRISHLRYAEALVEMLGTSKNPKETVQRFLTLLQRKKAFKFLPKILQSFEALWNERHGILAVTVSAPKRFESRLASFSKELGEKIGKHVQAVFKADDRLVGGVKLRYGEFLADGSIKHRLEALQRKLLATDERSESGPA